MLTIKIRQAADVDLPSLSNLYSLCGKSGGAGIYFERCLNEQNEGRRFLYIAEADGKDCGFTILNLTPRYRLYQKLGIPEIQDLNVVPASRRQGIGAALIRYCEDIARSRGATDIGISVGLTSNFGAAQRLYVRLGYIPDGNGVTYDRAPVSVGEVRPMDDDLCLMLVKPL